MKTRRRDQMLAGPVVTYMSIIQRQRHQTDKHTDKQLTGQAERDLDQGTERQRHQTGN